MTTYTKFLNKRILLTVFFLLFFTTPYVSISKTIRDTKFFAKSEKFEKKLEEKLFKLLPKTHSATWYNLSGNKTYTGETFDKNALTAAYNFKRMGTILKITNLNNNKSVIVRVNDKMGSDIKNRIDLSKGAFTKIADTDNGRIRVQVEELKKQT